MTRGRPATITSTTGFPVSIAASIPAIWSAGSVRSSIWPEDSAYGSSPAT
jgi:hypothetical protein